MSFRIHVACLLAILMLSSLMAAVQAEPSVSLEQIRQMRETAKERQRRVIYNNDGGDVLLGWEGDDADKQKLLEMRTTPLVGSQVDSYWYSTGGRSFDGFRHDTKVARVVSAGQGTARKEKNSKVQAFIDSGQDALKVMVEFSRQQGWEVFWSMRMNDTHDAGTSADADLMRSPWKDAHPHLLVGSADNPPPYGQWSSVNYAEQEVQDRAFAVIEEVCQNYDIDGIELDFFRHLCYLKSSAWGQTPTQEELDLITGFMKRVREMTERVGMARGKPILVAVRIPDSVPFARQVGLDIEKWMQDGLIDLAVFTGYFRHHDWKDSAELAHRYGVKAYAGLSEYRGTTGGPPSLSIPRKSEQAYFARAAVAWAQGMDGVYLFNRFVRRSGNNHAQAAAGQAPFFIGSPETLAGLDKVYFDEDRGWFRAGNYVPDHEKYIANDNIFHERPRVIQPGETITFKLDMGETVSEHLSDKVGADIRLRLWFEGLAAADRVTVTYAGQTLKRNSDEFYLSHRIQWNDDEARKKQLRESYGKKAGYAETDGWLEFDVPAALVTKGQNPIGVTVDGRNPSQVKLGEVSLWLDYIKKK